MMNHFKIIILIILFLFNNKSYAEENIVEILKKNNNIIFIRHSLAPGTGDPENISLKDCKTQRNLNNEGIKQSKKIGFDIISVSTDGDFVDPLILLFRKRDKRWE